MNKKKVLTIIVILIFTTGILMGSASASHTFKYTFKNGKYKKTYTATVSDKQYNKLKKGNSLDVKCKQKYTYKKPILKKKKVKKYKWVYKYKLSSEHWYGESEYYYPKAPKGYKWCGTKIKDISSYHWKSYNKYKKKVAYWTTKKVKTGKYKKAKTNAYMSIYCDPEENPNTFIYIWATPDFNGDGKYDSSEFTSTAWAGKYINIK